MAEPDRGTAAALARKLRDAAGADPDILAAEIMAIIRGRGYRLVIQQPEDWKHGGSAPDGPGRRALARARAERGW